ncbi:MAG TPA: type II secretion system protein [Patescibacteria group bacterium]|nr:type II secretion system protein [Patescibacteria group bacterium]
MHPNHNQSALLRQAGGETGFTLIELLVVISIIGLLSSVILVSLNGARLKARDARRISDMRQLETALDLYYQNHSVYPTQDPNTPDSSGLICGGWDVSSYNAFLTALVTDGIVTRAPVDPINSNNPNGTTDCGGYAYRYFHYAGSYYCTNLCHGKDFYVLGVNAFESSPNYQSPGWRCTNADGSQRDWSAEFAWVTAKCE